MKRTRKTKQSIEHKWVENEQLRWNSSSFFHGQWRLSDTWTKQDQRRVLYNESVKYSYMLQMKN